MQDLQQATATAFALVTQFGYSPKLGNVDLASNYDKLSSETKQLVWSEVGRLMKESLVRATNILTAHQPELHLLAKALIEYETLTKDEMVKVLRGEKLDRLGSSPSAPLKLPDALEAAKLGPTPSSSTSEVPEGRPTAAE